MNKIPFSYVSELLREMPVPGKTEAEWSSIESSVFTNLDKKPARGIILNRENIFRSFYGPAIAAAAVFILALNLFFNFNFLNFSNKSVIASLKVLNSKGDVSICSHNGTSSEISSSDTELSLKKGEIIKAGSNGGLVASIEHGTGFLMSPGSEIQILKADKGLIQVNVIHGDILFSVQKRKNGDLFIVKTPNAECTVVGTIFKVAFQPGQDKTDPKTHLSVFQGTVNIKDSDNENTVAAVSAGQNTSIQNHYLEKVSQTQTVQNTIRDISMLTLALESFDIHSGAPSGLVELNSSPKGATVSINGQTQGTTPIIMTLPEGVFNVEMTMNGYHLWSGKAAIKKNQTNIVSASLQLQKSAIDESAKNSFKIPAEKQKSGNQTPNYFVNKPEYVEAMIQITIGEYYKALSILESLRKDKTLSVKERAAILRQTALCYRGLGDFERAVITIKQKYEKATDIADKAGLLWEMANIQASCLGDYKAAEKTLKEYLLINPSGQWAIEARSKLAEVSYLVKNTNM